MRRAVSDWLAVLLSRVRVVDLSGHHVDVGILETAELPPAPLDTLPGVQASDVELMAARRFAASRSADVSCLDELESPYSQSSGVTRSSEYRATSPMGPSPTAFGHPGSGGSIGFADPRHRFAFALTKTRLLSAMPGQDAAYLVAEATRDALGLSATEPMDAV